MRKSTNNTKISESTIKQIANQDFQDEKDKIEI